MKKGIFIAGAGTDTGKTYISALITKKLISSDINAGYYKAVISGGPGDAEYVCQKARLKDSPKDLISFVYDTPVSPHLAANVEKNQINIEKIINDFQYLKKRYDYLTVEGAGGLICPLKFTNDEQIMQTDIIRLLNLNIILCIPSGLGTINSTVLTTFYAKENKLNIKGIIMNNFEEDNFLHLDNKKMIELLTGIPILFCVPPKCENLDLKTEIITKLYGDV
jgi:dethiobiotin synthetase